MTMYYSDSLAEELLAAVFSGIAHGISFSIAVILIDLASRDGSGRRHNRTTRRDE